MTLLCTYSNLESPANNQNKFVQRKVIIRSSDGTTKVVNQPVVVPAAKPEPQKVQVIRGPDGKISVRGLVPGQQLIQTADGKLHVVNTNTTNQAAKPATPAATSTTPNQQPKSAVIASKPNIVAKPVVKTINPVVS